MLVLALLIFYIYVCIIFGLDKIIINPSIKINYIFNDEAPISTFEWKKWGGHHGLSEPSTVESDILLNLGVFANRWLKPDASYFYKIPAIKGTNLPDLSWFTNQENQELVLNSFPIYLEEYGKNEPYDLIYCLEGCTWPSYMVNNSKNGENATCESSSDRNIPYNYSSAASLVIESLKIIYSNTSKLPKYFEPQNEPWTDKFGKDITAEQKIEFQKYINNAVYKEFGDKLIVGGPAMDGISWFKTINGGTVFSEYFEAFISNNSYPLKFISWHHFSSFVNNSNKYIPCFWGSGAVSATMDLIESYTNSINHYNGATKILISEHGYSDEEDLDSGQFNISYLQYIAVTTYITDSMLFLERPESQYKIDAFYLNGKYAMNNNYPLVLINESNQLTMTGNMYYFNKLLKDNGGDIIQSIVNQGPYDRVKVHSFYNNNTNKLVVAIKEISWIDVNLNVTIIGLQNNEKIKGLKIYWDSINAQFIYQNITVDLIQSIYLNGGSTLILYDIPYQNKLMIKTLCRRRYYSNNFSIKIQKGNITDILKIDNNEIGTFYKGILRVSLSWNIGKGGNDATKLRPQIVKINGNILESGLNRVDNLVKNTKMAWVAFEYEITKNDLIHNNNTLNKVNIYFGYTVPSALVTSVVAEVYTLC